MKAPFLVLLAALSALAVSQPAPWPMERQDRYGTARAIAGPPEQDLVPPYVFRTLSTEVASHAPSLGANGIGYFPTWVNNRLFKFDYRTGDVLGSFLTNNFNKSAPCISSDGSFVYLVNTPPLGNTGGLLYKINTDTMTTGWTFPVNTSHPNDWESNSATAGPDDDVVYGSSSGTAWRLDKTTGQPVWTKAGLGSVIRTIVFSRDDSKVFISNGQHLTAVDYTTGATAWSGDLGSVAGAPAVAPTGEVVVGNAMGQVRALNPDTGAILWTTSPGTKITGAPVFGDGKVYVPCHDQKLYAFSLANGTLAWEFTTSHPIWVGAIVDHLDRIYVWNRLGDLYCLRPNGDLVWTYRLPGGSRGPMSMGDDGTLYVSHSAEGGNLVHGVTMIGQKKIKVSALTVDPSTVSGGSSTTATVTIDSPAPKNGLRVDVTTNSSALIVPQFTTVPAQATSVSFTVGTTNVGAEAMRQVSATAGGVTRSASITIRPVPALASLTLNPSTVVSGSSSTGTVSLTRPASAGGAQVQLTANTTAISIPSSVTIAEGETSATFTANTTPLGSTATRSITATYNGVSRTASLTMTAAQGISTFTVTPSTLEGGSATTGNVTLGQPAPAGGATVTITPNSTVLSAPSSLVIPEGSTSGTFTIQTAQVSTTVSRTITVSYSGSSKTATVTMTPYVVISEFTLNPSTIKSGQWTTGTVRLNFPAGPDGVEVLITPNSNVLYTPYAVQIPQGSTTATFPIISARVGTQVSRSVTVTYRASQRTAFVTLTP